MGATESTAISRKTGYGREYIEYSDGSQWTRKLDRNTNLPVAGSDWTPVEPAPSDEPSTPETRHLAVIVENWAERKQKHWSLFCYIPDATERGRGQHWQVTGEAMHFVYHAEMDIMDHGSFAWHQVMNSDISDAQAARIDEIAREEPPPHAEGRASMTGQCQGWTIRVLQRLAEEGMVEEAAISTLRKYMDPIS